MFSSHVDLLHQVDRAGRVCDKQGHTIVDGGVVAPMIASGTPADGAGTTPLDPNNNSNAMLVDEGSSVRLPEKPERVRYSVMYWVSPIRVLFAAENPALFAQRIIEAFRERQRTEALIRCV